MPAARMACDYTVTEMGGLDPNAAVTGEGLYGLSCRPEESKVVLIPAPWEATVSYRAGTADGPEAILRASRQVDLFDRETGRPYEAGISLLPISDETRRRSDQARRRALPVIEAGGTGDDHALRAAAAEVDAMADELQASVHDQAAAWLAKGKLVGVVGGDHSTPLGAIRAIAAAHPGLGVLQIDAHADLREAYEGFRHSHASIMRNVVDTIAEVHRLVQVGVRDYCEEEDRLIAAHPDRIVTFFDPDLRRRLAEGETFSALAARIAAALPGSVYVSLDIDGLDPSLCPHTGTPVPGGLSFGELMTLIRCVVESGRRIVGFDLSEVAPDPAGVSEWDANVGARVLYKLIGFALRSVG
jgi:agmatinase